ncbi:hypothetical protein BD770DRAFT_452538 [Pilaira anomala]|nr:hypothetical protein BD770DRAFT_452538 [Pilaira anomala]
MNNWFISMLMVAITALLCFHISCDAKVIPQELSKRVFTAPDPEKALTTTRTGLNGLLAATQQAIDNQFSLFEQQPAPGPVPVTNDPDSSTTDTNPVPDAGKEEDDD